MRYHKILPPRIAGIGWQQHDDRCAVLGSLKSLADPFAKAATIRRIAPTDAAPFLGESVILCGVIAGAFGVRGRRANVCLKMENLIERVK
jgi:hypothetical protein